MSDTVFRTAQEPDTNVAQSEPTKPAEEVLTPRTPEHHDSFATYYDAKGIPLTAEYLGIENIWNESKELKAEIETIEKYFQDQVLKQKLSNSTKQVKQAMKDMEKKAGISPYDSPTIKIQRLTAYIEFREKIDG